MKVATLELKLIHTEEAPSGGWWSVSGKTCVAAYQPKGAASYAASKINLANPGTYDAAEGIAPSWAATTGWAFDGLNTAYLDTGVTPNSGNWSALVRYSNAVQSSYRCVLGSSNNLSGIADFYMSVYSNGMVRFSNGGIVDYATPQAAGVIAMAGRKGFLDGVDLSINIPAWGVGTTYPLRIGRLRMPDPAQANSQYTGNIQAIAVYSDTLTTPEVATVSTAMAAL